MATVKNVLESVREEDFVEYFIFPVIDTQNDKEQEIILNRYLNQALKILEPFTKGFLWHKDAFKLTARTSSTNQLVQDNENTERLPPHLHGVTHFGDNIEDEWFIVYLLHHLSLHLPDTITRVHDADGEFLLIEAANHLPPWSTPETSTNRVYIHHGAIHLIPPEPDEDPSTIPINEALTTIRDSPSSTAAPPDVTTSILKKIEDYPGKIQGHAHRATAYLPVGVAAILRHNPQLIAPAVNVFINRDPVDIKACRAMRYFPPENRVKASVVFTKCLYAMLTHSKYAPDRRTGWNLPKNDSPQFKAHDLGVKIACGFEILVSQAKPSEDVEGDRNWHQYLSSLKSNNYFRELLEGSRDYNDLLNKAKEFYINHRDSMHYAPAIGQEVLQLTKNLDFKADELKQEEFNLPPEDSDDWLNITPEELEVVLQEKYGKNFSTINNNSDAGTFSSKISSFLEQVSDFEGVEPQINGEAPPPVRPPRKIKADNPNRMSFDPDSFSSAVQNILDFVIPEDDSWDLESDSDMSDYAEDKCGAEEETYEDVKGKMQRYMEEMDKELAATTIGESFEKVKVDGFEDIENFKPVDIDVNALKNILQSYKAQLGEAGPSSTMLGPMGLHLDDRGD